MPDLQIVDWIPSQRARGGRRGGVRILQDDVPGGLVRDVGIQGDGAVGEIVNGKVPVDDRFDAVFLRQGGLERIIGLFQGIPVGDDGEIDPDFLDRIARRGHLAAAVAGEITGIGTVPGALESGLDQFRRKGR